MLRYEEHRYERDVKARRAEVESSMRSSCAGYGRLGLAPFLDVTPSISKRRTSVNVGTESNATTRKQYVCAPRTTGREETHTMYSVGAFGITTISAKPVRLSGTNESTSNKDSVSAQDSEREGRERLAPSLPLFNEMSPPAL